MEPQSKMNPKFQPAFFLSHIQRVLGKKNKDLAVAAQDRKSGTREGKKHPGFLAWRPG